MSFILMLYFFFVILANSLLSDLFYYYFFIVISLSLVASNSSFHSHTKLTSSSVLYTQLSHSLISRRRCFLWPHFDSGVIVSRSCPSTQTHVFINLPYDAAVLSPDPLSPPRVSHQFLINTLILTFASTPCYWTSLHLCSYFTSFFYHTLFLSSLSHFFLVFPLLLHSVLLYPT